jgi:palmitoyl-protein thioesterase
MLFINVFICTTKPIGFNPSGFNPSGFNPIILMHGIESHAENLNEMAEWLETTFNRKVYNIELGDGDDYSTDTPLNIQIDEFNKVILNITELDNGFDFIGISQGGLIGRGYVERYENKVNNMITLVSPHGGVYDKNLGFIDFYNIISQKSLSFAGYWRDPTQYNKYLHHASFLPDINNERLITNIKYKENMIKLKNFVMVYSPNDEIIKPPSSGIFNTFDANMNILELKDNSIYINDKLGLRELNNTNRLHMYQTNCTHVEHRMPICFPQLYDIFINYLKD